MSQKTKSLGIILASAAAVLFTTLPATSAIATDANSFSVETPGSNNGCHGANSCPNKNASAANNTERKTPSVKNKYRKKVWQQGEQPATYSN